MSTFNKLMTFFFLFFANTKLYANENINYTCMLSLVGYRSTVCVLDDKSSIYDDLSRCMEVIDSLIVLDRGGTIRESGMKQAPFRKPDFQGRTLTFARDFVLSPDEKSIKVKITRIENGFWGLNGESDLGTMKMQIPGSSRLLIPVLTEGSYKSYQVLLSCSIFN